MVAQIVKNLFSVQKTQVQSLGWEDPLEKEMTTHSVFLPEKSHEQRSLEGYSPWGHKRVGHNLVTKQQTTNKPQHALHYCCHL